MEHASRALPVPGEEKKALLEGAGELSAGVYRAGTPVDVSLWTKLTAV